MAKTRLCSIYTTMKQRCYNPHSISYKNYGGRGITICSEWLIQEKNRKGNISIGYENFKIWALNNGYSDNLTIDRIDVNKGYSPDNCRWVTIKEQSNNRRTNRLITYKGKTQTMKQWAEELGIGYEIIESRLNKRHWSVQKAFETKEYPRFIMIEYKGRTQNLTEWCKELDLNFDKIKWRLKHNWSVEKAFETKENVKLRMITYKGKTQSLKDWCKELNLNYHKITSRLNDCHWSIERAFETK